MISGDTGDDVSFADKFCLRTYIACICARMNIRHSRFQLRLNMCECLRQCVWACRRPPASRKFLVEVYLDKIMNSETCVSDQLSHAPVRNVPTHTRTFKRKRCR